MKTYQPRWSFLAAMFGHLLLVRLLPYALPLLGIQLRPDIAFYPWNFSPAHALCLFGGAYFQDRRLSVSLPLLTILASDLGIWALSGRTDWAFYPGQWSVYVSFAVCTALGFRLQTDRRVLRVAGTGLLGCLLFFVVTNFVHWTVSDRYAQTLAGLLECYVAALPWFRNTLLSTAVFGGLLFSPLGVRVVSLASDPNLGSSSRPVTVS